MDFKCVYFGDNTEAMMRFAGKYWHLVFNIEFVQFGDPGEITGWCVRLLQPTEKAPQIRDILGR